MSTERDQIRREPFAPQPPAKPAVPFSDEALILSDAPVPGRREVRPAAPDKLWIERVHTVAGLEAIEAEWSDLASSAAEPNPFYEPAMLLPAMRAFARSGVEVVLIWAPHPTRAKGRRELCGLFPLQRRRGRVEMWKHPYCYLCTPLLREGSARETLSRFFDWLESEAGLVRFDDVPGDGAFRLLVVDELAKRGWLHCLSAAYTRAVLRRAGSGDEFVERALEGKRRKELRRQRARLAEHGRLEVCELLPGEDPRPWIREFLQLEASGWKGRDGVAAAVRPGHREYAEEAALRASEAGRLQMLALRLDGKPIALKWNLLAGEGSFAFKIAFDESYARFSPGVLLELDNIHRVHERGELAWMDSCAAPNRFMINHLWPDRREMQTLFFATGRLGPSLVVALLPLFQLARARLRRRRS